MTLKTYLSLAAALLMVAACSDNKKCTRHGDASETTCDRADRDVTYTGILPAADAPGVEYTLTLDYDDDGNGGDYKLTERFIDRADGTFKSKGEFSVHKSTPTDSSMSYIKLVPDHTDRAADQATSSAEVRYFLVDSDSTLTMTGPDLKTASSSLNYTLTRR